MSMYLEFGSEKDLLVTGMTSQVSNHEDESWKNLTVSVLYVDIVP